MDQKDPTTWDMHTWLLTLGMGALASVVHNYQKHKLGKFSWENIIECTLDAVVCIFVNLVAFLIFMSLNWPVGLCVAVAGFISHRTTRFLFIANDLTESEYKRLKKKIEDDDD